MDEKEFKKLASNSRDWLIYSLLTNINPTLGDGIPTDARFPATDIISEHVSGVNIEEQAEQAPKGETTVIETETFANWVLPKTGKFLWFKMSNEEGKMRMCENEGCDLFLKYNNDKQTYEHWKMDANTGKAFFVSEQCEGEYNG